MDSQAHSSSDPTGSDYRSVCKVKAQRESKAKPRLNWDAITKNQYVASRVENQI